MLEALGTCRLTVSLSSSDSIEGILAPLELDGALTMRETACPQALRCALHDVYVVVWEIGLVLWRFPERSIGASNALQLLVLIIVTDNSGNTVIASRKSEGDGNDW